MENLNVNAIETIIRDRRSLAEMFAIKFNEWLPKDRAFHTGFALQVLMGQKKLLKLSEKGSPSIPKTKETPELDKPNMFRIINEDNELKKYIPDNSKSNYISLEFYHSLFFHKKRGVFDYLYGVFEQKKRHSSESIKKTMNLQMPSEVTQKLFSYKSNFDVPKSKPFFQLKRYMGLFGENIDGMNLVNNNNQQISNSNMIMAQERNIHSNNENINVNHLINNQIPLNVNMNMQSNDLFFSLVKSVIDYLYENNYHNIQLAIQNENDRNNINRKVLERLLQYHRYENFRSKNLDDQVEIIGDIINHLLAEDY